MVTSRCEYLVCLSHYLELMVVPYLYIGKTAARLVKKVPNMIKRNYVKHKSGRAYVRCFDNFITERRIHL